MVSKMFNIGLENVFFSNTPTLTVIMLMPQNTIVFEIKIPIVLLLAITLSINYLNKVNGAAFSLIMIMLRAKFLFVRMHPLAISNILSKGKKI